MWMEFLVPRALGSTSRLTSKVLVIFSFYFSEYGFGGNSWQENVKENEKSTKCLANGEFTRAGRATIFNVVTSGNATTGYNKKNVCPLEINCRNSCSMGPALYIKNPKSV